MQLQTTPMTRFTKIILWFVALNALAGAGSLLLFPKQTDQLFFWTITPAINANLFGALYLSGALAVGWLTWRGEWEPARFLIPVLVSAGLLISLVTLGHRGVFTPGVKLFYWLVVYVGAPLLALGVYGWQERQGGVWQVQQPVRPVTRRLAVGTGGLLVVAGTAVLLLPAPFVTNWPWPTGTLMVRIFTAWFIAFGVGLLWFGVEKEWTRLRHVANLMIVAALFDLLILLLHWPTLTGSTLIIAVYAGHLLGFALLGMSFHWLQRSAKRIRYSVTRIQ